MPSVPTFRAAPHLPEPANDAVPAETADVRFRLAVPALGFDQYLAMQAVMANRHMRKPAVDPGLVWLIAIALVGAALIAASFMFGVASGLYVDVKAWGWSTHIGGGPLLIVAAVIAGLAYCAAVMRNGPTFLAYAAALHAEGRDLFGPQELELTDDGIRATNGTGVHFVRWGAISDLILDQDVWYVVLQGSAAIWLPETAIRAAADPDGLRAFLKAQAGTARTPEHQVRK
jgi:hypothetical protein